MFHHVNDFIDLNDFFSSLRYNEKWEEFPFNEISADKKRRKNQSWISFGFKGRGLGIVPLKNIDAYVSITP